MQLANEFQRPETGDLKMKTHYQHSAAKATAVLGQLRQAFHAWNTQSFTAL